VLLLDEPFGALDADVRKELRRWLRRLHDELHITSVFVTHDQEEAMEVANRVVVMNRGVIEQVGTPDEVYDHPATAFVSRFLGGVNLFHGRINDGWFHIGNIRAPVSQHIARHAGKAAGHLRPHEIELSREPADSIGSGVVSHVRTVGAVVRLELMAEENPAPVQVELPKERYREEEFRMGERLFLQPRTFRVFADA
jgi:sulfate transport system ATP-binding protein